MTTEKAGTDEQTVRVWDPLVRVFHWSLVTVILAQWATGGEWNVVHETLGYIGGVLIAFRVVWGFVGPRYARFSQFVRPPRTTIGFLRDMAHGRDRRYIGHNPAGAMMIVALLVVMVATGVAGFMNTLPVYHNVHWIEDVHAALVDLVLIMVAFHVGGVVHASLRHKENLVRAMFVGRKRSPAPDDIK